MNNNKQSSVEFLEQKFISIFVNDEGFKKAIEQAKAIHKEEIEDAYKNGWDAGDFGSDCSEEIYYNKTFGGNNEQQ